MSKVILGNIGPKTNTGSAGATAALQPMLGLQAGPVKPGVLYQNEEFEITQQKWLQMYANHIPLSAHRVL